MNFSSFVNISPPNAAYKINSLIQKGYVTKEQSPDDKREYHLSVTQKYFDYCNISQRYLTTVLDRVKERFPQEACGQTGGDAGRDLRRAHARAGPQYPAPVPSAS